jgi:hypothetical protein
MLSLSKAILYLPPEAIGPLLFFAILLAAPHAFTIYQLVSGRAGCWPWQTKNKTTIWWLYRAEQPSAYWFRIVVWSCLCAIIDWRVLSFLLTKFG